MKLQGKTAVITGAGSGIGRASALLFASEGAKLVIGDKSEAVHETARAIVAAGGTVTAMQMDAGLEGDVQKLVGTAVGSYGGLDVAYANAGISGGMTGLFEHTPEEWAEILRVNLIGPFLLIKHAGQAIMKRGSGSIICTASVAGIRSGAGCPAYSASKAGVINLVQTSAQQLSATGVRVNAICPGLIETGMTERAFEYARDKGVTDKIGRLNPLRRAGQPIEIAQAALFLASDASSYVNGQAIVVDGGLSTSHPVTRQETGENGGVTLPTVSDPHELGFDPDRLARIEAHLQAKYIDGGRFPHAALLIGRGDEVAHLSVMGDARPSEPLKTDAIFRIASMTKPVTSIAFMQLVEQGRIALSDPITKVLPEFAKTGVFVSGGGNTPFVTRPPASPIRMIDLLRHTSGLTYSFQERSNIDAAYRKFGFERMDTESIDVFIDQLSALPLEFDPGTAWNYSVSTDVLGAIVERLSGQSLAAYFAEHIFGPLDMVDTQFDVPAEQLHRLPDCYVWDPVNRMKLYDKGASSAWSRKPGYYSGGGGLTSTLTDYYRFARMLLNGGELDGVRIVAPHTLKLMASNHLPGGRDLTQLSKSLFSESDNAGIGFGLGFGTVIDAAATMTHCNVGEFYWGGMFSTAFFVDPVDDVIMIFMTQLMPSSAYPVRREIKTMLYSALVG